MHIASSFRSLAIAGCLWGCLAARVSATENYTYKAGEYVTIMRGRSPDGAYSVATHGDGYLGYEHFRLYLMNGQTGKKIGPLEEAAKDPVDTGATAYEARWSADSTEVALTYRQDRHTTVTIRYRIDKGRAFLLSGPTEDR